MSKHRKDGVDWKSGPESLFSAARADHEATTDDYARVEAQLARRLAAGAPAKSALDGDEAAKLTRVVTPGALAKLGIAMLLVAAGSFGVVRMFDASPSVEPGSPPPPAAPTDHRPVDTAPAPTTTEPPATARAHARDDSAARVPPARSASRSLPPAKRLSASHSALRAVPQSEARERPSAAPASASEPAEATPASPAARASTDSNATESAEPTPARTEATHPVRSSTEPQPRPAAKPLDARAELALIERIHSAMRAANPSDALELCAEHAERWPRGVFAEEREAVSAIASCALRSDDALARAQSFLRKHPRAPTAPRVAAACAPLSAATKPAAAH